MMHKDLFAPKIAQALGELGEGWSELRCLDALRRQFEPELARQAAQLHSLRKRCKHRIGNDLLPFLREPNASQVTAPGIAHYRADRIRGLTPNSQIWDATCGLGMESLHLARQELSVIASDRSLEVAACARANLDSHSLQVPVVCTDALAPGVQADGLLLDPDRRPQGKRTLDPTRWSPTLGQCLERAKEHKAAAIKLPPAGSYPAGWVDEYRVEWISLAGELLECCLWLGAWTGTVGLVATRIERDGSVQSFSGLAVNGVPMDPEEAQKVAYLADPDPSLVRSGLLGTLAGELGLAPLAPQLGYLGGSTAPDSPFLRSFQVLESCAFNTGKVKAMLARHDIGPIQVRLRGHRERPEDLAKRFRGTGSRFGHVAVARLEGNRWVYLLEPLGTPDAQKRGSLQEE